MLKVHPRSVKVGTVRASGCHGTEVSDLDQRRFQGVEVIEAPLWGADEEVSGVESEGFRETGQKTCEVRGGLFLSSASGEC